MTKIKKSVKHPLVLGMVIYAVVFLAILTVGLSLFWNFIEAYEGSRPRNTIDAYVEQLTEAHICDQSAELLAQVDSNLQSEEACRELICEAVSGGVTYAKKSAESDDTRTVYALRSGSRVIGSVTMTTTEVDDYGFAHWEVTEESFDLSYLLGDAVSITVPSDYLVYANGVCLDGSYITESGIHYDALEAFYDDYSLPTMVTYKTGTVLGTVTVEVTDPAGNAVVINENTDYNAFLSNCTEEEVQELERFSNVFLERYVAFTSSAHKSSEVNYAKLLNYVVSGSDLHTRMRLALDGLSWAQSNGDKIVSITMNRFVNIGDGKYLCDATYEVDTSGREGVVRTTSNVKFIIVDNGYSLKAEMLISY